jgi:hypothetical protein
VHTINTNNNEYAGKKMEERARKAKARVARLRHELHALAIPAAAAALAISHEQVVPLLPQWVEAQRSQADSAASSGEHARVANGCAVGLRCSGSATA